MAQSEQQPKRTVNIGDVTVRRDWWRPYPGHGQGVVVYNIKRNTEFVLMVRSSEKKQEPTDGDWIGVYVNASGAQMYQQKGGVRTELTKITDKGGFNPNSTLPYWLSYDRDNLVIKYGQGYRMEETTLISEQFIPKDATPEQEKALRQSLLFNPAYYRYAELWERDVTTYSLLDVEKKIEFDFVPFVKNPSPVILDSSKVTLIDLDNAVLTPSASLPVKCQELYNNVINCEIDWMANYDEVKLSDAIRYSINTPGMTLYEKLKEKSGEFGGDDPNETYLRVTLGHSVGGSPGIPYVLEIWPKDHYSPIHNHGNAFAVIKVLHGGLTIHVYNKMTEDKVTPPKLTQFDANAGDATWISPQYYQTHKLWNQTEDYCATIQCYMYGMIDNTHWPYFDFLDDTQQIDAFFPASDFTFRELRDTVIKEYKISFLLRK